jgi:death on curing protein
MDEPIWVDQPEVLVAHSMQLAEHGGPDGIRDATLLESALSKARNVFAYDRHATIYQLAASYAFGIARNHPFVDGNKRTALVVSIGFLRLNGYQVISPPEEKYFTFLGLAEGRVSEEELTAWLSAHSVAI